MHWRVIIIVPSREVHKPIASVSNKLLTEKKSENQGGNVQLRQVSCKALQALL